MRVAAHGVVVEEIDQPYFAHDEFDTTPGNRLLQIEGIGLFLDSIGG
jgi:hypothetical protein